MRYCDDYAALLDLFVDGELSPEEMARVQAHLDACPGCRAYVDDALAIRAAFPNAEETEVPEGFAAGVMEAVRAQGAPERPQAAPKKRGLSRLLLPLAACCALVLVIRGAGLAGFGSADTAATTSSASDASAADTTAETEESAEDDAALAYAESDYAAEDAFGLTEDAARKADLADSAYFAILTLPADALETEALADRAPDSETDGEQRYELSAGDYAVLLEQLDAAGIRPIVREQTGAESETALVIVTGL